MKKIFLAILLAISFQFAVGQISLKEQNIQAINFIKDRSILFNKNEIPINIVSNYLRIIENFSPDLMRRLEPLNGFNPFSPMLFPPTAAIVRPSGGHTYRKIEALLNARNGARNLNIFETNIFTDSIFSECFITEISDKPSLTRAGNPMTPSRSSFVSSNEFYRSFKTVVVHVGLNSRDYIYPRNSAERYNFLNINFNNGILNPPIVVFLGGNKEAVSLTKFFIFF